MDEAGSSVVVDASAVVDLLARTPLSGAVAERLSGAELHAPHLLDAEVLSAVGRLRRAEVLDEARARQALRDLAGAPLVRHPLTPLLDGAWSRRAAVRLTDAFYVELASQLGVPLITTDQRLARAASEAEGIA